MSLLLDALKKAADDKQKASQNDLSEDLSPRQAVPDTTGPTTDIVLDDEIKVSVNDEVQALETALDLQDLEESLTVDAAQENAIDDIVELQLEEEVTQQDAFNNNDIKKEALEDEAYRQESSDEQAAYAVPASSAYSVSDEALSLLIYKTNRDVKYSRRIIIFGLLITSLLIVIAGGFYYYLDMENEIAGLERKHKMAMQAMQSKTSKEKTPDKSEIIRNLVDDPELSEKVQNARQAVTSTAKTRVQRPLKNTANTGSAVMASPGLSIQKTNKRDPVGEKLDAAWLLYEGGQYSEAAALYNDVLKVEENNRDALMGLGAIAIIEKNDVQARDVYLAQLEQDPRDPVATAALSSLQKDASALKADEEHLLSMLAKNPDTPHLKFALGNNYAQQNNWQSAQQYYFGAWQHDAHNADYIFNLAVSMDQLGKPQQAIGFYKDSLLKAENKPVSFSRDAVKKRISELSR